MKFLVSLPRFFFFFKLHPFCVMVYLSFHSLKNEKLSSCSLPDPSVFFQGGDLGTVTDTHLPRLYLLQWLKSDRALMMLFNDGTFQVNFRHRRQSCRRTCSVDQ